MSETLQSQILAHLAQNPEKKADEIAKAIGSTRTEINQALYGLLKGKVRQDRSYRWSLALDVEQATTADGSDSFPDTDLARLCRYYLACLGYDDAGVSTFLTSQYGEPDYCEVKRLPRSSSGLAEEEAARRILGRKRTERGRYGLYFGYPTHVSHVRSRRSDWEGFMVEPLLLFPVEQDQGSGRLIVDLAFPIVNQKPFQAFTSVERDGLMNELVQLEQELGVGGADARPDLDELAMRLQAIRPEWPWRETIDASRIADERAPMSEIRDAGIYNRAVVIMAEKSPFTQGLEKELRDLASLPEQAVAGTVLGAWLKDRLAEAGDTAPMPTSPLLEVLPMNTEQHQAVAAALTKPVTIITGPPGTGKSQVVTNLLVNAAWAGKRVLFASKNNKAVDVVETRVNALGSRPVLLRMGASQSFQARLAEHVLALMAATISPAERSEFTEAKGIHEKLAADQRELLAEAQKLVALRNAVDQLEREAEEARRVLGDALFANATQINRAAIAAAVNELDGVAARADRAEAPFAVRLFWPLFAGGRISALAKVMGRQKSTFEQSGVALPTLSPRPVVAEVRSAVRKGRANFNELEKAAKYLDGLKRLQQARPLEEIDKSGAELVERVAAQSDTLWKLWLRLQPSRLTADERKKLAQYSSLLRMVIEAGDEGQLSSQARKQYATMLAEISHLLPCWAVTSLSARGRIPFQPGAFDLVVFDEASQCDIASALPLLYRAKAVVVIGDPKQLSHISGLQKGQDQALLEKHGLMADYPHWAYSYQSLFGLAATQVAGDEVVHLVDHHRSHADIIGFSNKEFYEGRLRVATSYNRLRPPTRTEPGVRWVDVRGRVTRPGSGALNTREAAAVVEFLRDLVLTKGYSGTVGVVTPFRAQANAITQAVNQDEALSAALIQRQFLADTVHKFQGDERDVMLFSPVVSDGLAAGALGFLNANGNLFNVAITRARAQLVVVGDLQACGTSSVGYLSRFASYAAKLQETSRAQVHEQVLELGPRYPQVARPELVSDWERNFYVEAYAQGVRLIPQYPIEKYLADFVLIEGDRRLVVEIDGERYHRNWTGELCRRDQIRNQRMFELGYDVIRFWVYEVRDDLPGCLRRLSQWRTTGGSAA